MAIYFIQAGKNGPIKIGYSDNPQRRLEQLQTANPYQLELLWVYDGDISESEIHSDLSHERVRGEWFHPSRNVFEYIKSNLENYAEFYPQKFRDSFTISEGIDGCILISTDLGVDISFSSETKISILSSKHPFIDKYPTITIDGKAKVRGDLFEVV